MQINGLLAGEYKPTRKLTKIVEYIEEIVGIKTWCDIYYSIFFLHCFSYLPGNKETSERRALRNCGLAAYDNRWIWLFPGRGFNFVSLGSTASTAVSRDSSVNSCDSGSG